MTSLQLACTMQLATLSDSYFHRKCTIKLASIEGSLRFISIVLVIPLSSHNDSVPAVLTVLFGYVEGCSIQGK